MLSHCVETIRKIFPFFFPVMEAACSTEPLDESELDESVRPRWFTGFESKSDSVEIPSNKGAIPTEIKQIEGRSSQRVSDDTDYAMEGINDEIDPHDILSETGMFFLPVRE